MTVELIDKIAHLDRVTGLEPEYVHGWLTLQYAGSLVHGTHVPSSNPQAFDDVDILGVWLPGPRQVFGLQTAEHWMKPPGISGMEPDGELDLVTYEVRKFARLLSKANPNVLGMLWAPPSAHLDSHPYWSRWVAKRDLFLSMRCYSSFSGYAYAQLMKLGKPNTRGYMGKERKQLFATYGYDIKNAAHCIRLLRMGAELFETGVINVDRTDIDAEQLREIKSGKWTLSQIEREAQAGFDRLRLFKDGDRFPQHPDESSIEQLVMDTVIAGVASY